MLKKILFISLFFSTAAPSAMQAGLLNWAVLGSGAIEVASFLTKRKIAVIGTAVAIAGIAFVWKKLKKKARKINDDLMSAVKNNDFQKTETAIKNGANVNQKDGFFEKTILMVAAREKGDSSKIIELLLKRGADIDGQDRYGWTALIEATVDDNLEMVNFLLKKGATVDKKNMLGWTALITAVVNKKTSIINTLLAAGANPLENFKFGYYTTPLEQSETIKEYMRKPTHEALMKQVPPIPPELIDIIVKFAY